MPVYEHTCQNKECNAEWESEYSIKADPPKDCPKCLQATAKRMISLGAKGIVELFGQDLVDKVKSDTVQLKKDMRKDERFIRKHVTEMISMKLYKKE